MKRFAHTTFTRYIVFLLLFFLYACASVPSNSETLQKGLLWKIESQQLPGPSYLFGTIHSEDPRVATIEGVVKESFDQSSILALEIELDANSMKAIAAHMYYTDGQKLSDKLDEILYARALKAMSARGLPADMVLYMKPWAVFSVLSMPEAKTGEFLDAKLYKAAKQQNKQVNGLETIREQIDVFDKMKLETQISLLKVTLDNQSDFDKMLNETIDVYLSRDMQKIESLNAKYLNYLEPQVAEIFTQRLLVDRNKRMVDRMQSLLKKGNAFIAVGALHLPGEQGLIKQLTHLGYQLTPVY